MLIHTSSVFRTNVRFLAFINVLAFCFNSLVLDINNFNRYQSTGTATSETSYSILAVLLSTPVYILGTLVNVATIL